LRAAGQLSDDAELAQAIPKNVITRSLGPNASVHADIEGPIRMKVGDTFLLCSDGLTGRLEDDEIAAVLTYLPLEAAGHMLIDLANLRGGPDNITVVLVKITDSELATPKEMDDPITIGSADAKAIHPAIWACASVCLLASAVLSYTHNGVLALIAFVGGLAALVVGFVSRLRSYSPGVALGSGRRLGKGPYARAVCPPSQVIGERFLTIATDLRSSSASSNANAKLNWIDFDRYTQESRQQLDNGKSIAAINSVAKAMRALMQSIRDHQNKMAEDSNIDL
jgi:protein phosphatase